ncbi:hypothetical protein DITRI_Ditri01bG0157700 [Diplodiscus trichospermus]
MDALSGPKIAMGDSLKGKEQVILRPAGPNLFIIKFPNSEACDRVLERGPWHIQNRPLIVRKWELGLTMLQFHMSKIPIWIQLGNVPLELFTQRGLSYIASAVGRPLYMDRITASQQRLAYAKVCLQIDVQTEILSILRQELYQEDIIYGEGLVPKISNKEGMASEKIDPDLKQDENVEYVGVQSPEVKKCAATGDELVVHTTSSNTASEKAGSVNRFSILNTATLDDSGELIDKERQIDTQWEMEEQSLQRQLRASSARVAELMKSLKPQKRGPIDKGKVKKSKLGNTASVGLIETRIKHKKQGVLDKWFSGWNSIHNYEYTPNGGIWLLWKSPTKVNLVTATDQSITVNVEIQDYNFFFNVIYEMNNGTNRKNLWRHILDIHHTLQQECWILAGDFNIIAHSSECSCLENSHVNLSDMADFKDTLSQLSLFDHAFAGPFFTWSNHQQSESFLARKLDRLVSFPPKPFRFFNYWKKHPDFLDIVEKSWSLPIEGKPMPALFGKLKRLKKELKSFNHSHFSGISARVSEKRAELAGIQHMLLASLVDDELV